jgi:hypothetical protein
MDEVGESGQWETDINEDGTGVIIRFAHLGENGVETFEKGLPPAHAVAFAASVLNMAIECGGDLIQGGEAS